MKEENNISEAVSKNIGITSEDQNSDPAYNSVLNSALEWLEMFAICFAVVLIAVTFVARHSPVIGSSMRDTLHDGDIVIVHEFFYKPAAGDIIVAQSVPLGYDEPIVKRVIATGGQTVDIDFKTWNVYVDGEKIDEPYIESMRENEYSGLPMNHKDISFPLEVPEGYLFVMGDNRNGSMDSRDSRVGLIDERMVIGHVLFRLFPFDAFGTVS